MNFNINRDLERMTRATNAERNRDDQEDMKNHKRPDDATIIVPKLSWKEKFKKNRKAKN